MVTPWKRVACWLCRRTSHRLVACLAVVVVLLAVPTAVSILGQRSQQQVASESPVLLGLSGDISEMRFLDADIAGWQTGYMTDVTTIGGKAATAPTDQSRAAFLADEASIDKQLRALRADPFTTPERADLSGLAGKWRTFFAADAKMVQILRSRGAAGLPAANAIASGAETDVFYAVLSDCDKALASVDARAAASARQVNSTASSNEVLAAAIFAAVLALVVLLARVLVRSITRPVGELNSTLASMSAGDLTVRAEVGSSDEFGELGLLAALLVLGVDATPVARDAGRHLGDRLLAAGIERLGEEQLDHPARCAIHHDRQEGRAGGPCTDRAGDTGVLLLGPRVRDEDDLAAAGRICQQALGRREAHVQRRCRRPALLVALVAVVGADAVEAGVGQAEGGRHLVDEDAPDLGDRLAAVQGRQHLSRRGVVCCRPGVGLR